MRPRSPWARSLLAFGERDPLKLQCWFVIAVASIVTRSLEYLCKRLRFKDFYALDETKRRNQLHRAF